MAGEQAKLSTAVIEIAGRNWLTAQLLTRGFEVATPAVDRGIDLIVFREVGVAGIRALPFQLKCATAESFSLDNKYAGRGIPLAYVWNVLTEPVVYFLQYDEALNVLGEQAVRTESWMVKGYYARNHISAEMRSRLEPYLSRWEWLEGQVDGQPASGSTQDQ